MNEANECITFKSSSTKFPYEKISYACFVISRGKRRSYVETKKQWTTRRDRFFFVYFVFLSSKDEKNIISFLFRSQRESVSHAQSASPRE